MSLAIAFPMSMMTLRKAAVAGKTVSGSLLRHLLNIVAATAGAGTVGEEMPDVPSRAGVLVEAAVAVEDFLWSPHLALPFRGFDPEGLDGSLCHSTTTLTPSSKGNSITVGCTPFVTQKLFTLALIPSLWRISKSSKEGRGTSIPLIEGIGIRCFVTARTAANVQE